MVYHIPIPGISSLGRSSQVYWHIPQMSIYVVMTSGIVDHRSRSSLTSTSDDVARKWQQGT